MKGITANRTFFNVATPMVIFANAHITQGASHIIGCVGIYIKKLITGFDPFVFFAVKGDGRHCAAAIFEHLFVA